MLYPLVTDITASIRFIQQHKLGLEFREAFLLKIVLIEFYVTACLLIMFEDFIHHGTIQILILSTIWKIRKTVYIVKTIKH
jgi:hypothetical protein